MLVLAKHLKKKCSVIVSAVAFPYMDNIWPLLQGTESPEFEKFLSLLGDKITLKGWTRFAGGLDLKSTRLKIDNVNGCTNLETGDRSGKYSVFTEFSDYEIMFHVSTLLPYEESDPQQIERKKHIGNDVVVIIFQDPDCELPWDPLTISSRFNRKELRRSFIDIN